MSKLRKKVETWVREQLYGSHKGGTCTSIIIRHLPKNSKVGEDIHTIEVPKEAEEDFLDYTVSEILSTAESDATGIGENQSYAAYSFHGKNKKHTKRLTFCVMAQMSDSDESEKSEQATKQGHMAQMMRHNNALFKNSVDSMSQVLKTFQVTNTRLSDQNEALMADKLKTIQIVEELTSLGQQRQLETKKQEAKIHMMEQSMEKLTMLMPHIVNKLTGKKMLPAPSGIQNSIESLAGSITEEQVELIQSKFTPEQQAAIMDIIQSGLNNKEGSGSPKH
jgi:hypothetical protein